MPIVNITDAVKGGIQYILYCLSIIFVQQSTKHLLRCSGEDCPLPMAAWSQAGSHMTMSMNMGCRLSLKWNHRGSMKSRCRCSSVNNL